MYEQSHRDYLRSGYLHHRLVTRNVNHYRDNAITYKAQRDKNARELKLANAAITDMQMRQRDVAALDAGHTKELADAKAENDALRRCCRWSSSVLISKTVCQPVREATTPPAWIMQPRLADTAGQIIIPCREVDHYANNWKEPRSILMSSADRVAHIEGNSCNYCEHTRASSGV